jgi:hypothetical protein
MKDQELKPLTAKLCFEHLGGSLGGRLFSRMLELKWFVHEGEKKTHYRITELGISELEKLGVDVYERR